jgi:hypothetical protein
MRAFLQSAFMRTVLHPLKLRASWWLKCANNASGRDAASFLQRVLMMEISQDWLRQHPMVTRYFVAVCRNCRRRREWRWNSRSEVSFDLTVCNSAWLAAQRMSFHYSRCMRQP